MNMPGASAGPSGAADFLLRRMQRSRDFPALSETVRTLNGLASSDHKSTGHVAGVIVRDYALTNKILKVVNSAYYAGFAGKVGTISRAIVVLGLEPIRSLAASLILFEHMAGDSNAERIRALIGKSMFSALLARQLASERQLAHGEEAFLAAMFHNLGELLVAFYLPEEDAAIRNAVDNDGMSSGEAQGQVLGVDYSHLGMAIGRSWNFPNAITFSMKPLPRKPVSAPTSEEETLRQLAALSHEITDRLAAGGRLDDKGMAAVLERFKKCTDLDSGRMAEMLSATRSEYRVLAEGMATPERAPAAIRALTGAPERRSADDAQARMIADVALPDEEPLGRDATRRMDPEPVLVEGLQEATAMLAEGASVSEVAQVVLESIYRAFGLRHIALCLRVPARREFAGRIGFGDDIDAYLRQLRFGEAYERDVFHVALKQRTDVHIADLALGGAGHGIPKWYAKLCPSGSLLFLPLVVQERIVGCVIADHASASGMQLDTAVLRLVRALRNQLALAIQLRR